jgi:hypothetical protein
MSKDKDAKPENANIAILDSKLGIVIACFKGRLHSSNFLISSGLPDEMNNSLLYCSQFHTQSFEKSNHPLQRKITRIIPLKVPSNSRPSNHSIVSPRNTIRTHPSYKMQSSHRS